MKRKCSRKYSTCNKGRATENPCGIKLSTSRHVPHVKKVNRIGCTAVYKYLIITARGSIIPNVHWFLQLRAALCLFVTEAKHILYKEM
jgi:hypothetical protein